MLGFSFMTKINSIGNHTSDLNFPSDIRTNLASINHFADRGGPRGALQEDRHRDSDAAVVPVGPVGRGAQPAAAGRAGHRRPLLRGGGEARALRGLQAPPLRKIIRLVLYR